ncbi:GNAT family N-acetyltransferase [Epibacterium sp. SM1979]|uniref:GNAT family N-acetyltransferase n=1 Tax=Tritonibacter litoralis TaxID=2662264 RepID=A0A843YC04_9RHOB|nr:GNAT family N-acetyltransferase [Tritonibacter litoralis]
MRPIAPQEALRFLPLFSRYLGESDPQTVSDAIKKSKRALNRADHDAFWLLHAGREIGFAVVLHLPEGQHELSDFTIFPEHRRHGYGQRAARHLFARFPGRWRMGVSSTSLAAAAFWGTCLSSLANVENVATGAPFTSRQSKSFSFCVKPGIT